MNLERWAWGEFWKDQSPHCRACLDAAPPSVRHALSDHWQAVASKFEANCRILDLGCGNGTVGRQLSRHRSDLQVDGVDYASEVAQNDVGCVRIWPRTPIESLPFGDESFGGAVSQFGFEYCRLDEGVVELARVLAPGAPVSFLIHHAEGPIAADNQHSVTGLKHLLSPVMADAFLNGRRARVVRLVSRLRSSHRSDPTVDTLARSLVDRVSLDAPRRRQVWSAIEDALRPELALAAALVRSAVPVSSLTLWLSAFTGKFEGIEADELRIGSQPFGWRIEARRRSSTA